MDQSTPLQAVVFDLDGLIVNTEDLYEEVIDEMLHGRGKTHDRELRNQMMGRSVLEAFRIMVQYHALPDLVDDLATECRVILTQLMDTSLEMMPGFRELADALEAAAFPFAIATASTQSYAEDVLTRLRMIDRFRFILTADHVERGKPAPDIYLAAADRFELRPDQIMVLEDSANGCRAGVSSGAFTVAVPNAHTIQHDFAGARFVADTLADPRIRKALAIQDLAPW